MKEDSAIAHLKKIEVLMERLVDPALRKCEYKVVMFNNKVLTAAFDPVKMADLLNEHANHGWTVKGVAEFDPPSFTGDARAIVVIMERTVL
jgi:hypothetical protein